MKNQLRNFKWLFCALVFTSCDGISQQKENKPAMKVDSNVAVVELFTSEGCSSCPPADKLLRTIQTENKDVYVLSYHVDYWDRLGWKDPFSQAAFTERQRDYAERFSLESIYTPQVVINGSKEFVGSDEQKLRSILKQPGGVTAFEIQVQRKSLSALTLSFSLKNEEPAIISVALIQPTATTEVKKGENGGRTLQHVNVVRQLTTREAKPGDQALELTIPSALQADKLKAIVFIQQKKNNHITAAASADVPSFLEVKSQ